MERLRWSLLEDRISNLSDSSPDTLSFLLSTASVRASTNEGTLGTATHGTFRSNHVSAIFSDSGGSLETLRMLVTFHTVRFRHGFSKQKSNFFTHCMRKIKTLSTVKDERKHTP